MPTAAHPLAAMCAVSARDLHPAVAHLGRGLQLELETLNQPGSKGLQDATRAERRRPRSARALALVVADRLLVDA